MSHAVIYRATFFVSIVLSIGLPAFSQNVSEPSGPADWSKEYKPFRIVGNVYYVGTYDLACYLVTTSQGNILINTGLASSEPMIQANIEALGFKMVDTKILLITQAHYDHTGAIAAIRKKTGAKLLINQPDGKAMDDGGKGDFGVTVSSFAPAAPDRLLHDHDTIRLGDMKIVMLNHPGHTKGSCSYLFDVKDGGKTYRVLIVNMPSIVIDRKFSEVTEYPTIEKDYAYTFQALKNIQFDIWLSSHASQFSLHSKHKQGDPYNPSVFIDRSGYDKAVNELKAAYDRKVSEK
jgi:metallo-beta-lactamase class B